ncbi:MAG: molybdopterin-dependent oxidoreductase, partial [Eggerthellaceae bacterium]|nr:molybdopterin-dependent oxidoreductase [Eggerthellaceae bacterium]
MLKDGLTTSRRTFLKGSAALGGLALLGEALSSEYIFSESIPQAHAESEEVVTWGHCAINCPGHCPLRFHVKDDEVVWIETDTSDDNDINIPQVRCCSRGRSYRRWLNHPDRLKYPMKRVGKRGEGKFERITWDEAIET